MAPKRGPLFEWITVARMSAATCGLNGPGYRFAHPGYGVGNSQRYSSRCQANPATASGNFQRGDFLDLRSKLLLGLMQVIPLL